MGKEIERKFLLRSLPDDLSAYRCRYIEQAYLSQKPVIRIRKSDDEYYMTYKGGGLMERIEYNLPLDRESFEHLLEKADGHVIKKKRYEIPLEADESVFPDISKEELEAINSDNPLKIELDIFSYPEGLVLAEVEFPDRRLAEAFVMPDMFKEDVTEDPRYHNSNMI
ncbi:MAG: CYTH domain-containing protein [Lachnospiraceae bacterium]|nr:CYTH domain-containing protein [Lachnospiraceae bacterium]